MSINLVKDTWTKEDIEDFHSYEKSLKGDEINCTWEKRIVNTQLECFARTSTKAREIFKNIKKGNYYSFLDNIKIENHMDSLVCAFLICSIKDQKTFEKYLDKYVLTIDNWASCDTLKFKGKDEKALVSISQRYVKSAKPFIRRVGINIYFDLVRLDKNYVNDVFTILDNLKNEKEYYVNMVGAWILSECFAKNRDATLEYFKNAKTNEFIINKGIQKCRDSYRVSNEDKELLLLYKK